MKTCSRCKVTKPLEDFNKKRASGVQPYCRPCQSEYAKGLYQSNPTKYMGTIYRSRNERKAIVREYIEQWLREHPCVDCGHDNWMHLEFDHISDDKSFNISEAVMNGVGLEKITEEIAKCEVRCKHCHSDKTHERANSWRWLKEHGEQDGAI